MRASEFIAETKRVPPMSLRHINKMKKDEAARQASFDRRDDLVRIMYANPAWELQQIELEKARIELAQQKAELTVTRAEAVDAESEAIAQMAHSGLEVRREKRKQVSKMAKKGLGRRKKA